jgi:mitogen-activated protein kinase 15
MSETVDDTVLRKYQVTKRLGKGSYGIVWKARDRETNETVAIKKCFDCFQNATDSQRTFREISLLQQLGKHENIVQLYEVIPAKSGKDLYVVCEFMEADLGAVIRAGVLEPVHVQYISYQILCALKYMHAVSVVHRDIKPANILLDGNCRAKLCDFGLARILNPSRINILTSYVATRWYRAPEILLKSSNYGLPVDIWATGTITAEMITGKPLLAGTSTVDQVERIIALTGWPSTGGFSLPFELNRNINVRPLCEHVPKASVEALEFLRRLLQFDPSERVTAKEALNHPFLYGFKTDQEPACTRPITLAVDDNIKLRPDEYKRLLTEQIVNHKTVLEARFNAALEALHSSS